MTAFAFNVDACTANRFVLFKEVLQSLLLNPNPSCGTCFKEILVVKLILYALFSKKEKKFNGVKFYYEILNEY